MIVLDKKDADESMEDEVTSFGLHSLGSDFKIENKLGKSVVHDGKVWVPTKKVPLPPAQHKYD